MKAERRRVLGGRLDEEVEVRLLRALDRGVVRRHDEGRRGRRTLWLLGASHDEQRKDEARARREAPDDGSHASALLEVVDVADTQQLRQRVERRHRLAREERVFEVLRHEPIPVVLRDPRREILLELRA